jgi:hypothetical protein
MGSMAVCAGGEELQVGVVRELSIAVDVENIVAWPPCEGESEEGDESDDESTHVRLLQMETISQAIYVVGRFAEMNVLMSDRSIACPETGKSRVRASIGDCRVQITRNVQNFPNDHELESNHISRCS